AMLPYIRSYRILRRWLKIRTLVSRFIEILKFFLRSPMSSKRTYILKNQAVNSVLQNRNSKIYELAVSVFWGIILLE
ncbi:MAG: hypothetical protein WA131_05845, partial [Desulfitobacteriaceae bacterium]